MEHKFELFTNEVSLSTLGPGVVEVRINNQIKHVVIVEMDGIVMDVNTIVPHILQHVLRAGL